MDDVKPKSSRKEDPRSVGADGKIPDYESMKLWDRIKYMQLPSWQPEFATPWVVSALVLTTAVFIPMGALIIIASDRSQTFRKRYDNLQSTDKPNGGPCDWSRRFQLAQQNYPGVDFVANLTPTTVRYIPSACNTQLQIKIEETMEPPVYFYYEITEFHQNFRKLVNSRSDKQLAGITDQCECRDSLACLPRGHPSTWPGEEEGNDDWVVVFLDASGKRRSKKTADISYGPCGQMPWAMFNDSFRLVQLGSDPPGRTLCDTKMFDHRGVRNDSNIPCDKDGITWPGDSESDGRYRPFPTDTQSLTARGLCHGACTVEAVHKPGDSNTITLDQSSPGDGLGGSVTVGPKAVDSDVIADALSSGHYWREWGHKIPIPDDLDFVVWSRPATLPTFRKLMRIIREPLTPGDYVVHIEDRFPVGSFSGEKRIIFATRTWIGADNTVLGGAYTALGSLACVFALAFVLLHLRNPNGGYTKEAMDKLDRDAFSKDGQ